MKFSDIAEQQWESLKPYLDTCLLPITGLNGTEAPWEATDKLERLRDAMDCIEIPFKGRVVTYPAYHYTYGQESLAAVGAACRALKEAAGFRYAIVISVGEPIEASSLPGVDLVIGVDVDELRESGEPIRRQIGQSVQAMWFPAAKEAGVQ